MSTDILSALPLELRSLVLTFFVILARVAGVVAFIPVFGERSIPVRIKLAISLCFSILLYPILNTSYLSVISPDATLLLSEIAIGVYIGLTFRLALFVLQVAGSIASQATSLAQVFGTATTDPQPAIGHILVFSGLALMCSLGLHVYIVEALVSSYRIFPVAQLPNISQGVSYYRDVFSDGFALAFSLAAPFFVVSILYNIALGVINRAMPQLMVALVGAPAITLGSLFILYLSAPIILEVWTDYFFTVLDLG